MSHSAEPDPQYAGGEGRPTFGERFVTAIIHKNLHEWFGNGLEVNAEEAENGKMGNKVLINMPDEEDDVAVEITVREVKR